VAKHLARDYRHPVVETDVGDVKFDYLKCVDLYHGRARDAAAKQRVCTRTVPIGPRSRRSRA